MQIVRSLTISIVLTACGHAAPPAAGPCPGGEETIGAATQQADGTLVLDLRASGAGAIGDARLVYPPSHAQYAEILAHVGPIQPGESRPVCPFP